MRDAFGDQLRAAQAERELADVGDALRRFAEENGFNPELGARELLAKAAGSFRSCSAMSDARYDEIRRLRAEIEAMRPRLMPEGMEWPRTDEDKPVVLGDELIDDDGAPGWREVDQVSFYRIGDCIEVSLENSRGVTDSYCMGERVKRPAPKVLDADGVEIRAGDAVWIEKAGDAATVMGFSELGGAPCVVIEVAGCEQRIEGDRLTHRAPVLAADGKPLREGETVYGTGRTQHEFKVRALNDPNPEVGNRFSVRCFDMDEGDECWCDPLQLTNERPDSWEQWRRELIIPPCDYCKRFLGIEFDHETQLDKAFDAQGEDLERRAKKLAERDR